MEYENLKSIIYVCIYIYIQTFFLLSIGYKDEAILRPNGHDSPKVLFLFFY